MIEELYKSGEYMDELDNLENVADTLLQVIMDDGKNVSFWAQLAGKILNPILYR